MRSKKNLFLVLISLVAWGFLTGMGAIPTSELPTPDVIFHATIIDDHDIATKCDSVSWRGKTFFEARRGGGVVTIPFEKVQRAVYVSDAKEDSVNFKITLKTGDVVAVTFDSDARFYGRASFGTYRITAKNIKEIVFTDDTAPLLSSSGK